MHSSIIKKCTQVYELLVEMKKELFVAEAARLEINDAIEVSNFSVKCKV